MAAILKLRRGTSFTSPQESELFFNQSNNTLLVGITGSSNITLAKVNDVNTGSFHVTGDITASNARLSGDIVIGGNIYLGDAIANDNISVNASFSGSLIPSASNEYDLGSSSKKWKNLWVVSASIDDLTVGGSGILSSSVTNFTDYSSSVDTRLDNSELTGSNHRTRIVELESTGSNHRSRVIELESTGSNHRTRIVELESTGSDHESRIDEIETTFSSSVDSRLDYLEGDFSSSVDLRLDNSELTGSNHNNRIVELESTGSDHESRIDEIETTFSSSVDLRLDNSELTGSNHRNRIVELEATGSDHESRIDEIETTFSSSVDSRLDALETDTGSQDFRLDRLEEATASLDSRLDNVETTTASFDNRITDLESTGSDHESRIDDIETTFSSSVDLRLDYLEGDFSSSVDSRLDFIETDLSTSLDNQLNGLYEYTSSLKNSISVNGQDLVVYGDLTVQGTTTTLNTTELVIEDKLLSLASGSTTSAEADGAGLHISGADASMIWDDVNSNILFNTKVSSSVGFKGDGSELDNVVAASVDFDNITNKPTLISGSDQVTQSLDSRYLEINGDNVVSSSQQITDYGFANVNVVNSFQDDQEITGSLYLSGSDFKANLSWPSTGSHKHLIELEPFNLNTSLSSRYYGHTALSVEHIEDEPGIYHNSIRIHVTDTPQFEYGSELNVGPLFTHLQINPSGSLGGPAYIGVRDLENASGSATISADIVNIANSGVSTHKLNIGSNTVETTISSSIINISGNIVSPDDITAGRFFGNGAGLTNVTASYVEFVDIDDFPSGVVSQSIQVDHDATTNFVANEHIDHTLVSITGGNGLIGGGDLTLDRTLSVVSENNGIIVHPNSIELDVTSSTILDGIKNKLNDETVISGSSQVDYLEISNIPANIISGSSFSSNGQGEITASSNDISTSFDVGLKTSDSPTFVSMSLSNLANFNTSVFDAVFRNGNGLLGYRTLGNASFFNVSASVGDDPNSIPTNKAVSDALIAAGAGDITAVNDSSLYSSTTTGIIHTGQGTDITGIYGTQGNVVLAIDTGSTHFVSGVNGVVQIGDGLVSGSDQVTQSLDTRYVNVSGDTITGDLVISGDLTVNGTTTTINTTNLNVEDNIIELNYGGSATEGGLYVKDATGGSTVSGSLLWNSTTDRWIAGISGSEFKLITDVDDVHSGSYLGTATTSDLDEGSNKYYTDERVKTKLDAEGVLSGSIDLSNIHAFTSSAEIRLDYLSSYTQSADIRAEGFDNRLDNIQSFTSSIDTTIKTKLDTDNVLSGSIELLLPSGVVSGSSQINADETEGWADDVKTQLDVNTVISGSTQVVNSLLNQDVDFGTGDIVVNDITSSKIDVNNGYQNIYIGTHVGRKLAENSTSVSKNTAVGYQAFGGVSSNVKLGNNNTSIGYQSLYNFDGGNSNTAIGAYALKSQTIDGGNTAIGSYAGQNIVFGGGYNTLIGETTATTLSTGGYNTIIGAIADVQNADDDNSIVIGYNADGNGSNTVVIGNNNIVSTTLKGEVTASGQLVPSQTLIYDLGTEDARWRDLYLSGSIDIGGALIFKNDSGNIEFADASTGTIQSVNAVVSFENISNKPTLISGSSQVEFNDINDNPFYQGASSVTVFKSIVPSSLTLDLGSPAAPFKDIYLSSASLYIDGAQVISSNLTELIFSTDTNQSLKILETGADTITLETVNGDITLTSSGTGNIELDAPIQIAAGNQIISSDGNEIQFGNDLDINGDIIISGNVDGIDLQNFSSSVDSRLDTQGNATISFGGTANEITIDAGSSITLGNGGTVTIGLADSIAGDRTFQNNVTIDGDLTVGGTTTTVNTATLAVEDNMIYLNSGSAVTNPDLGFAGNYNDGSYAHLGLFSDASDGHTFKFYKGYTPEPDAASEINTSHASFQLADLDVAQLDATSIAIGGTTINATADELNYVDGVSSNIQTQLDGKQATLSAGTGVSILSNTVSIGQSVGTDDDVTFGTIRVDDATASTSKTTGALIVDGGAGIGLDLNVGGDVVAYATSDRRLKDNITPIENSLQKINQIGGYSFVWNENQHIYKGKDYGVIAQEIEEILPELVDTRENGYKAVKYDRLVSLLIEGIKELSQEVKELKEKIK